MKYKPLRSARIFFMTIFTLAPSLPLDPLLILLRLCYCYGVQHGMNVLFGYGGGLQYLSKSEIT